MLHVLLPPAKEGVSDDEVMVDLVLHAASVRAPFVSHCDYVIGVRGRKIVTVRKVLSTQTDAPLSRRVVTMDPSLKKTAGVLITLGDAEPDLVSTLLDKPDPLHEGSLISPVRVVELAKIVKGVAVPLGRTGRSPAP